MSIGVASTRVLGPNPRRKGLIVSAHNANGFYLRGGQPAVVGDGIFFPANTAPQQFGGELCMCWLTEDIFGIAVGGAITVSIVEVSGDTND